MEPRTTLRVHRRNRSEDGDEDGVLNIRCQINECQNQSESEDEDEDEDEDREIVVPHTAWLSQKQG